MTPSEFYAGDRFILFMDLRSITENDLHGSGMRLVNTKEGVQLAINRNLKETGTIIPRSLTRLEPESTSFVIPPNSNMFPDWRRTCHVPLVKTQ